MNKKRRKHRKKHIAEMQRRNTKIHVEDVFYREGLLTEAERDKAREIFNKHFKHRYYCMEEDMYRRGLEHWKHVWNRNMRILGLTSVIVTK